MPFSHLYMYAGYLLVYVRRGSASIENFVMAQYASWYFLLPRTSLLGGTGLCVLYWYTSRCIVHVSSYSEGNCIALFKGAHLGGKRIWLLPQLTGLPLAIMHSFVSALHEIQLIAWTGWPLHWVAYWGSICRRHSMGGHMEYWMVE